MAIVVNFGLNATLFSIFFRGLAIGAALSLLVLRSKVSNPVIFWLFMVFWSCYFIRLFVSLHILDETVSLSLETYWLWSLGTCFLPSLAILVSHNSKSLGYLRHPPIIVAILTVTLLLASGSTYHLTASGEVYDISRLNIASLNPISMGHAGATAVLIGICVVIKGKFGSRAFYFGLVAIALGAALAILANSRGPIVSLAFALAVLLIARARRRSTIWIVGMIFFAALFAYFQYSEILLADTGPLARFSSISLDGDASSISRFISFRGAFEQFVGSPVFGDGIEERIIQQYPHNVILEAFMATGVVGGVPFLVIVIAAIRASWGLLRLNSQHTWVSLIAIQNVVGAQFSGAIWSSGPMWVMITLAIVCWRNEQTRQGIRKRSSKTFGNTKYLGHPTLENIAVQCQ
jgi:O-antigen ligase